MRQEANAADGALEQYGRQKSTFVPETIFGRSIRLKQTGWTIQTHSDELN